MRYFVLALVIVFLFSAVAEASTMSRDLSIEFEGEIDYESVTGNNVADTATVVEGSGSGTVENSTRANESSFSHDLAIEVTSDEEKVKAVAAAQVFDGSIYATKVNPSEGETGSIDQDFSAANSEFPAVEIAHKSEITHGLYERYIDIEKDGMYLRETLRLLGVGRVMDLLTYEPPEEPEEEEVEEEE